MRSTLLRSLLVLGCFALPVAQSSGSNAPQPGVPAFDGDVDEDDDGDDEAQQELEALRRALVRARRPADREAALAALIDEVDIIPGAEELLSSALTERWQAAVKSLESAKLEKKFTRLLKQRETLDAARKHALDLIFDEEAYFYPYRQPDVSAKKAAQYHAVQADVSERVAAVQAIWSKSQKVKLPKSALTGLEEMQWLRTHAANVPEGLRLPESLPEWASLLPFDAKQVDLSNFPLTAKEAEKMARDRKAELYNQRVWEQSVDPKKVKSDEDKRLHASFPSEDEREQVRVTNAYRNMLGRPSLTWDPRLQEATRHHSDYLTRTGEFSHFQKVQETRTPFDRMRLAGYTRGVSENISLGRANPADALAGWMTSSGHHRNMIMAGHKQMASAVAGNIWTQNFGVDSVAEKEL